MSNRVIAWEEAVRSLGAEPTPRVRPSPLRWIWYAFWGPLPSRHRVWVLYDTTCATWVVRHIVRLLTVVALPIAAIAIWLPGPGQLRGLTAFVTGFCALLLTAVWVNEGTEYRLVQADWAWGTGSLLRERRSEMSRRLAHLDGRR